MQTDPIGYKSDLDLYAYVGGDPINRSDPTGLYTCDSSTAGCQRLGRDLRTLRELVASGRLTKSQMSAANQALSAFGAFGKGGPAVTFDGTARDPGSTNLSGTEVNINYAKIDAAFGAGSETARYRGIGVVVHEGRHVWGAQWREFSNLMSTCNGFSCPSRSFYVRTEQEGFRAEYNILRALGEGGFSSEGDVNGRADSDGRDHGDTECYRAATEGSGCDY